ncbi:MAG: efflux RND transporter periplasmic adaptor subunit [Bacteroidales bacterium]|nr:efflux RND transporter periplasmic adaptor subunit [Bacteroidales bacterium]
MKYRKYYTWGFILLIVGGGLLLNWLFTSMKPDPPRIPPPEFKRLVQTQLVSYSDINSAVEVPGRLVSGRIVDIISEVQGEILPGKLPMKKGQRFRKGDLICTIYDQEQLLSLKASKSRFMNAIANALADIKFDYPESFDKVSDFFESIEIDQPIPEIPEIKDKSLKIFLSSRDILNQYYTIKVAEERLQKHYKYAPFNGAFMEVNLEVGAIANSGSRIARIIKTDVLELEAPVEVSSLKFIRTGDPVTVLDETRSSSWKGIVTRISEFVDPTTQSVSVFVQVNNDQTNPIYVGMFLLANFNNKIISDAMEIPRQAVFNQNEVFVVIDSVLYKKKINIRKINSNTLLFDGLEEGEEVVVEPLINVREGTIVHTKAI